MISKGSFGFDVMWLLELYYKNPDEVEEIIRKYANNGSEFIRFLIFYIGKQHWKDKEWVNPWERRNGKVDFRKINKKWKKELEKSLKLLLKYNQISIISLFDGCHWTEQASPFRPDRNENKVFRIYDTKDLWLYQKTIDEVMKVVNKLNIDDFVIEIGNEPWFSNTPQNIAKFHREIIKYLYEKYDIKPSQIQVNATEEWGHPSFGEWLQAELLCDKTKGECSEFRKKNTGEGGIIFSYHKVGFPHHIDEGGLAHRPFVNSYVSTYFQTNNNFSNDGTTTEKDDPDNKNRPCAAEPAIKNSYCSPNKEELEHFYDYLLTKAKKVGLHFYTYSDLTKEILKAERDDEGRIYFYTDLSYFDENRISGLANIYKKHFKKYPKNYKKFPKLEPKPEPECESGIKLKKECPDGSYITVKICREGKWMDTMEECPEIKKDCRCKYWLYKLKIKTWFLCLFGLREKFCKGE